MKRLTVTFKAGVSGRQGLAALVLGSALGLQGCASIVSGSTQSLSVDTPGCNGARCELSNDKGKFFIASTPGTVQVNRSYNNLQVVCSAGAVVSEPVSVASTTKGMAYGNILFGGIIGAGVDVGTGAAYDYPQLISVPMQCGPARPSAPPLRLGIDVGRAEQADGAPAPGARLTRVEPGSMAEHWGLKAGDVLLRINGNPIRDPDALAAFVGALAADRFTARELELLWRRPGDSEDTVRRVLLPAQPASF